MTYPRLSYLEQRGSNIQRSLNFRAGTFQRHISTVASICQQEIPWLVCGLQRMRMLRVSMIRSGLERSESNGVCKRTRSSHWNTHKPSITSQADTRIHEANSISKAMVVISLISDFMYLLLMSSYLEPDNRVWMRQTGNSNPGDVS